MRPINRIKRQQLAAESTLVSHLTEAPRSINPTAKIEVKILIDELFGKV